MSDSEDKKELTPTFPKAIYIIRHSDKPTKSDGPKAKEAKGSSLRGLARANAWADYFLQPNPIVTKPDVIYAFNKGGRLLNRSVQCVSPLVKIGQYPPSAFITTFDNTEKETMAMLDNVFSPINENKVILICWEHQVMANLIQSIGKRISGSNIFKDFKAWSLNPTKGVVDDDLYSLVCIVNVEEKTLLATNQGNNFSKDDSQLNPDKHQYDILWTLPVTEKAEAVTSIKEEKPSSPVKDKPHKGDKKGKK